MRLNYADAYWFMLDTRRAGRVLLLWAAAWAGFALLRSGIRVVLIPAPPQTAAVILLRTLLLQLPWMLISPLVVAAAASRKLAVWHRALPVHLLAAAGTSVLDAVWSFHALAWAGAPQGDSLLAWYLARGDQAFFLYGCLAAAGIGLRYQRRIGLAQRHSTRLEMQLLHARLLALAAQLRPHFLFNTLHAVSELVHRDPGTAEQMLAALRELLRRTVTDDQRQEVPVSEEVDLLEAYARIQRIRFAGYLRIEVWVSEGARDALVPRLLLQPLVENAVRHGTSRRAAAGRVGVRIERRNRMLIVEVDDDGPGLPSGALVEGLGLSNTRARLAELYGAAARLSIATDGGRGTRVSVSFPFREQSRIDPAALAVPAPGVAEPAASGAELRWGPRRLASLMVIGWLIVGLVGAQADWMQGRLSGPPLSYVDAAIPRLGEALLWLVLTPGVLWLGGRIGGARLGLVWTAASLVTACLGVAVIHAGLVVVLVSPGLSRADRAALLLYDVGVFTVLAAAGFAWALGRLLQDRTLAAVTLERSLAAARLANAQSQIEPAFLDAVLDRIGVLAHRSPSAADELTGRLGELLRLQLAGGEAGLVTRVPSA